jgi:hypothetical protein
MQRLLLFVVTVLFAGMQAAFAVQPTWAKKATAFPERCLPGKTQACQPVRVPAPDGKSSVEVRYREESDGADQAYLRVTTPGRGTREAAVPESFQYVDLLWSPDSHAFFVDGDGDGAPVSGSWVYVYLADDPANPRDVTENAQHDMLKEFPPCKAAYGNAEDPGGCKKTSRSDIDVERCRETEATPKYSPEYNMTGIDWITSSSILVMAEIPCDTLYGGIMCQVMGYELEVPTGRILKRIDAKHLKHGWQKSMGWKFRIPDPPHYCE